MKPLEFLCICLLVALTPSPLFFTSCEVADTDTTCHGENTPCYGFDWSFVDMETYENLMGPVGRPIHPDSIVVLNMSLDTMYHKSDYNRFADWWYVDFGRGPYQELNCFNQCALDSAFSRFYYVYVGEQDWDTIEVNFPARTKYATVMEVYFNGMDASPPDDRTIPASSSYWFQKKIE